MQWHFLTSPANAGDVNMAFDEALMRRASSGTPVFRVYGWSSPTLSLGRNQRARGVYNLDAARDMGVGIVRRPTGGRALLHHREITYSAALRVADAAGARSAYDLINEVLLGSLARMGVPASRASGGQSMPPGLRPCFDAPSAREIVVGDRKLVGSAQFRRNGALLQHGSILVHDDQPLIGRLMRAPMASATQAATLAGVLGREPDPGDMAAALRASLASTTKTDVADFDFSALPQQEIETLCRGYADDEWTWRR